jgi:hypothetical protein
MVAAERGMEGGEEGEEELSDEAFDTAVPEVFSFDSDENRDAADVYVLPEGVSDDKLKLSAAEEMVSSVFGLAKDDPITQLLANRADELHSGLFRSLSKADLPPVVSSGEKALQTLDISRGLASHALAHLRSLKAPKQEAGRAVGEEEGERGIQLSALDPYKGMKIDPDEFPATKVRIIHPSVFSQLIIILTRVVCVQSVYPEADLSQFPSYPAQRTIESIRVLRVRSEFLALQRATAQVCQLLPTETQALLLSRLEEVGKVIGGGPMPQARIPGARRRGAQAQSRARERASWANAAIRIRRHPAVFPPLQRHPLIYYSTNNRRPPPPAALLEHLCKWMLWVWRRTLSG